MPRKMDMINRSDTDQVMTQTFNKRKLSSCWSMRRYDVNVERCVILWCNMKWYDVVWKPKSKTKQRTVFRMIHIKDSRSCLGAKFVIWFDDSRPQGCLMQQHGTPPWKHWPPGKASSLGGGIFYLQKGHDRAYPLVTSFRETVYDDMVIK